MTFARSEIVQEGAEGVYHCVSASVRGAFLCGKNPYTDQSLGDRLKWIEARMRELTESFSVEVCGFAVLPQGLHVILRTRPDAVKDLPDYEAAQRWLSLYSTRKDGEGRVLPPKDGEIKALVRNKPRLREYRKRLSSMSWFMRNLDEFIARRANKEDGTRGRFWEGRFKTRVLLDEPARLAGLVHVDLLPLMKGLVSSPKKCENSSVFERIKAAETDREEVDTWLCPIGRESSTSRRGLLSVTLDEYVELLAWTWRHLKKEKPKTIPRHIRRILVKMDIYTENWLNTVREFERMFRRMAGKYESMTAAAKSSDGRQLRGIKASLEAFASKEHSN